MTAADEQRNMHFLQFSSIAALREFKLPSGMVVIVHSTPGEAKRYDLRLPNTEGLLLPSLPEKEDDIFQRMCHGTYWMGKEQFGHDQKEALREIEAAMPYALYDRRNARQAQQLLREREIPIAGGFVDQGMMYGVIQGRPLTAIVELGRVPRRYREKVPISFGSVLPDYAKSQLEMRVNG